MKKSAKVTACVMVAVCLAGPGYAQGSRDLYRDPATNSSRIEQSIFEYLKAERTDRPAKKQGEPFSIIALFKSRAFAAPKDRDLERRRLREEWSEMLGLDVFYPYFKAREVQDKMQEKTKVNFLNMRGRAEFNEDSKEIRYIFKRRF
ncbi:MAG: hypothetical protein PHT59_00350 [Candidatus Omnitrophica bacterium]|nr:hypothetical protein [Candidatus Omnitrophota bacterium]